MKSDSSMGFWSFVLSALILAPGLGVGISHATGFANAASAASATAQVASAPQPTASQPAATSTPAAKSDDEEVETYEIKRGDTLTKVFGKHAAAVCKFNHLRNCNQIEPKQVLKLPEGITPREVRAVKSGVAESPKSAKAKVTKRPMPAAKPVQEESCIKLGTAPFNRYGDMKLRLQGIDLSPVLTDAEKDEAKALILAGRGERMLVTSDMVFEAMPFRSKSGQVKFVRNAKVCTPEQGGRPEVLEVWRLSTGKLVGDFETCGNIGPVLMTPRPEPPLVVETPPSTVVNPPTAEVPAPVPTPEPPAPQLTPTPQVATAPRSMCDHLDPAAVIGQEHEPRQNGDSSHSTFLTASVYCLTRLKSDDGMHGYGAKVTYSDWHGTVNNRVGHYQGWNALVGPSHKHVMDEGYDWEVSAGVGKQVERYHQAAYASRREFDLVGVTVGHNDYRRRLAGETWDVERQYFGSLTLPVGKKVGHTNFGQAIADTAELGRFNFGVQAGARWWFYENTDQFPLLPYLQGGIFVQHPTSASMSLRIGVADQDRVCGVGVGIDQDLQNGGDPVGAVGWWCDLIRGGQVVRAKVRKHQVITEAASRGVTIEERGGFIQTIRFGEPSK